MFRHLARLATTRSRLILVLTGLGIVLAAAAGIHATSKLQSAGFVSPNAPSQTASNKLTADFVGPANIILLVQAHTGTVDSPAVAAVGQSVATRLAEYPGVRGVTSYWATGNPSLRSGSGHEALVTGTIEGSDSHVNHVAKAWSAELTTHTGPATVSAGGGAVAFNAIGTQITKDLAVAEAIAIPITMLLLILAFGSVVAAALPVAIGLISIVTTLAVLFIIGSITDVSQYALNLTTAMSLGLAIDYSLLMVNRYREELAAGHPTVEAVTRAVATAGRTILFSAATVAAAMAALLVFPVYFLRSMAYAGISVVLLATIGALVVLPAILSLLGPRVNSWSVRRRGQPAGASPAGVAPAGVAPAGVAPAGVAPAGVAPAGVAPTGMLPSRMVGGESPFWRRTAQTVIKRPLATGLPLVVVLGVLVIPFTHVKFGSPDDRVMSPGSPARVVGDALRSNFPANASNTTDIVTSRPLTTAEAAQYERTVSEVRGVTSVSGPGGIWSDGISEAVSGPQAAVLVRYQSATGSWIEALTPDPLTKAAQTLVGQVRALPVPGGAVSYVGGGAASLVDQKHDLGSRVPLALILIVLTTFVVLWLFTGSVILPIKALVLNALTLSSVLGVAVWIFQYGHLASFFNFTPQPTSTTMPPLVFCIAFGLSMDYEVFVLSRIKELHDAGASNTDAVVGGLARTGRIVTTAAALMAVTFFAFATSKVSFIQMFAVSTGLAVLIDATLIRGILVPAFMRLAGDLNWWSPRPLRRLHDRIGLAEVPAGAG